MKISLPSYFGYKREDSRAVEKINKILNDPQKKEEYIKKSKQVRDKNFKRYLSRRKLLNENELKILEPTRWEKRYQTLNQLIGRKKRANAIKNKLLTKAGIVGGVTLGLTGAGLAAKRIISDRRKTRSDKGKKRGKYNKWNILN